MHFQMSFDCLHNIFQFLFYLVRILQVVCQSIGVEKMAEESSSQLHKERNKILIKFADHSFSSALDEINSELEQKKITLESLHYSRQRVGYYAINYTPLCMTHIYTH